MWIAFILPQCVFTVDIDHKDKHHVTLCYSKIHEAQLRYENEGFINFLKAIRRKFYYKLRVKYESGECAIIQLNGGARTGDYGIMLVDASHGFCRSFVSLAGFFKALEEDCSIIQFGDTPAVIDEDTKNER